MELLLSLSVVCTVLSIGRSVPAYNHPYSAGGDANLPDYAHYPHDTTSYHDPPACSCVCNYGNEIERVCEWKVIFKAVAGNGRGVYDDYTNEGNINTYVQNAMDIESDLAYRDGSILDNWNQLNIQQVKMEVYSSGSRKTWFLFDAVGKNNVDWMSKETLIASPYEGLKTDELNVFSVAGSRTLARPFCINDFASTCDTDCGYLMTVDAGEHSGCLYEQILPRPYFVYSEKSESCTVYADPDGTGIGDRLVLRAKVCEIH